jgi:hypothetical protein
MISSPPFPGQYSGYVIRGEFGGVNYEWDFSGVENCSGVRGMVDGNIMSENNSYLLNDKDATQVIGATDANPKGTFVGFASKQSNLIVYFTNENKYKCKAWT